MIRKDDPENLSLALLGQPAAIDLVAFWAVVDACATHARSGRSIGTIMRARYNADGSVKQTLAAIAQEWGVSREAVRTNLAVAMRRLRHPLRTRQYRLTG